MREQCLTIRRVFLSWKEDMNSGPGIVTAGRIFRRGTAVRGSRWSWGSGWITGGWRWSMVMECLYVANNDFFSVPEGKYFLKVKEEKPFAMGQGGNGCCFFDNCDKNVI